MDNSLLKPAVAPSPCENGPVRLEGPPLTCVHCGGLIAPGEPYFPAGRCAMGGVVTGPGAALYGDVLEPAGEHPQCAEASRARRAP